MNQWGIFLIPLYYYIFFIICHVFFLFGSQEFECTRMTESLTSYGDNTRLSVRLGRALLPGEHRGKVYLLEPHNIEDVSVIVQLVV